MLKTPSVDFITSGEVIEFLLIIKKTGNMGVLCKLYRLDICLNNYYFAQIYKDQQVND